MPHGRLTIPKNKGAIERVSRKLRGGGVLRRLFTRLCRWMDYRLRVSVPVASCTLVAKRSACPRIAETVVRTLSRPWLARSRAESARSLARCVRFSRVSSLLIGAKRIPKPIPIPNPDKKDLMLLKLLVDLAARIEVPPAYRDADSPRRL